jgi:choline kinase
MDLVIMAAGMGSRFGGLKQVEPVNDNGEFIIDYSIYDAIKAGFDRIVFIIKEENLELFRKTVGSRIESKIDVKYVFQDMKNVPEGVVIPESRKKPLGTGHAIYCLNGVVSDKFAIINADDFYGRDAFNVLHDFLASSNEKNAFASVNYKVGETLSDNGSTKRGVCIVENGLVSQVIESKIEQENGKIVATPLSNCGNSNTTSFEITKDNPVSMNMFALKSSLFDYLNPRFKTFLEENKDTIDTCEYLIPTVLGEMMDKKLITLASLSTTAKWHGVTYREDKDKLVDFLKQETERGVYPKSLWKNS